MDLRLNSIYPKFVKQTVGLAGEKVAVLDSANLALDTKLSKLQESSIKIRVGVYDYDQGCFFDLSSGSGVVVSPDGLVVTAKHVVDGKALSSLLANKAIDPEDKNQIKNLYLENGLFMIAEIPQLVDGELCIENVPLSFFEYSNNADIAIGALDMEFRRESNAPDFSYSPINPGVNSFGSIVYSMGHPSQSSSNVISKGVIFDQSLDEVQSEQRAGSEANNFNVFQSKRHLIQEPDETIFSSNYIIPGNSGGLLCDSKGRMVGMPIAFSAMNPAAMKSGDDERVKAHSESADSIIRFLINDVPELDLQKLLSGEEVDTPELIRRASLVNRPIFL